MKRAFLTMWLMLFAVPAVGHARLIEFGKGPDELLSLSRGQLAAHSVYFGFLEYALGVTIFLAPILFGTSIFLALRVAHMSERMKWRSFVRAFFSSFLFWKHYKDKHGHQRHEGEGHYWMLPIAGLLLAVLGAGFAYVVGGPTGRSFVEMLVVVEVVSYVVPIALFYVYFYKKNFSVELERHKQLAIQSVYLGFASMHSFFLGVFFLALPSLVG